MKTPRRLGLLLATIMASTLLTTAPAIGPLAPVTGGDSMASAETPAQRCARETAAYNQAWANGWAATNGKPASQAPPPPVPYQCGGNNEPPPTLSPDEPEEEAPTEDSVDEDQPTIDGGEGPNLNPPTERDDPASGVNPGQPAITPPAASGDVSAPYDTQASGDGCDVTDIQDCRDSGKLDSIQDDLVECDLVSATPNRKPIIWFRNSDVGNPNMVLTCGGYRHIIRQGHRPNIDMENFIICLSLVHQKGVPDSADSGNSAIVGRNNKTGRRGKIVYRTERDYNRIVTAYTDKDGRDWGGCAHGWN